MNESDDLLPSLADCRRAVWLTRVYRKGSSIEIERAKRWSGEIGTYSIYCLLENDKHVRYFGITNQSPESRLRQHISDCGRGKNLYKENWLRSCMDRGTNISIRVIRSGLTVERACMTEIELIRFFKKAFRLVNTHSGGATGYAGLSEESKEKHRVNTEKGLMAAWDSELEAIDIARGFCRLEEWEADEED